MTVVISKALRDEILADYYERLPRVIANIKKLYRSRGIELTDEQAERLLE